MRGGSAIVQQTHLKSFAQEEVKNLFKIMIFLFCAVLGPFHQERIRIHSRCEILEGVIERNLEKDIRRENTHTPVLELP